MNQPIIEMKTVDKYFGDFHVLKNINFEVLQGEIVVICGPSGSGKSTLIRCINRLEEIDSGDIYVEGKDLYEKKSNINQLRAETGMLFQHFNLFPHLTILENINIAQVKVKGTSRHDANEISIKLLEGKWKSSVLIITILALLSIIIWYLYPNSWLDFTWSLLIFTSLFLAFYKFAHYEIKKFTSFSYSFMIIYILTESISIWRGDIYPPFFLVFLTFIVPMYFVGIKKVKE